MLKIEAPFDPHALRIVRELPAVAVEPAADGRLRIDGRTLELVTEFKRRVGAADAWQMVRMVERLPKRPTKAALVVADRTTSEARRILADNGIGYIDGDGNAHLAYPGAYVHVERPTRGREQRTPGELRLAGKAAVAAQAMLLEPDREWRVTDLAERTGVSVGLAHAVLARLERLAIVTTQEEGRTRTRMLVEPAALLDLWAEENRDRGVRQLGAYVLPPRSGDVVEATDRLLRDAEVQHALTGVAAAALLAPFLTTLPAPTYWVDAAHPLEDLIRTLGGEPADSGANLVLMQADDNLPLVFANERDGIPLANLFRIYVDARTDPKRGREQADHFRRELIGW